MNTAIFKKAFCLVLCLFLITVFSVPTFANFEGTTEVIAHIEAESSGICSSDSPESSNNSESIISSGDTNSETAKTGDSSIAWIMPLTLLALSMVIFVFSVYRKKSNRNLLLQFAKIIISICLSTIMIFCSTFLTVANAAEDESTDFNIKIVHTNDIHARVEENAKSEIIGVERLGGIIKSYTSNADMDLVLDSGDLFHGQSIATLVKGSSVAELIKACGYDAMTAGNHDWNYGKDRLKELASLSGLKMLTGNVIDENGKQFFDDTYYTEEVTKNGQTLKVGIFGVIDPSMYQKTTPSNVQGLTFTDPSVYANKAASELKSMGCDVIIALAHTSNPTKLAETVNDVDLWLCGHEHMDIDTSVTTPNGETAYIAEDGYYLYQVGLIELNCTLDKNGNVSELKYNKSTVNYDKASEYEKDADVTALLEKIKTDESVILNCVVGYSPAELDGVWEHLRTDETNLGRAVTDSYLLETNADIAFENAGGIRANVKKGNVTYGDIISVSPYGNYIVTKKITGKQLKEILETSVDIQLKNIAADKSGEYDAWPDDSGNYLQVGGITVDYNPSLDYGKRIIFVKVGNNALESDRLYTVATNNFLADSSVYPQLAEAEEIGEFSACDEALIKYFEQSVESISESINTQRMIKTDKQTSDSDKDKEPEESKNTESDNSLPENSKNTEISSESSVNTETGTTSPLTGDTTTSGIYLLFVVLSGTVILVPLVVKARKNSDET